MICRSCGSPAEDNERFCGTCGAPLTYSGDNTYTGYGVPRDAAPVPPWQPAAVQPPEKPQKSKKKKALLITLLILIPVIAAGAVLFFVLRGGGSDPVYNGNIITHTSSGDTYISAFNYSFPLTFGEEADCLKNTTQQGKYAASDTGSPVDDSFYALGTDMDSDNKNYKGIYSNSVWRSYFGGDGYLVREKWISGDDFKNAGLDCTDFGVRFGQISDRYMYVYYDNRNDNTGRVGRYLYRIDLPERRIEPVVKQNVARFVVQDDKLFYFIDDGLTLYRADADGGNAEPLYTSPDNRLILRMLPGESGQICLLSREKDIKVTALIGIDVRSGEAKQLCEFEFSPYHLVIPEDGGNKAYWITTKNNNVYETDLESGESRVIFSRDNASAQSFTSLDCYDGCVYLLTREDFQKANESPNPLLALAGQWIKAVYRIHPDTMKADTFMICVDRKTHAAVGKWELAE